MLDPHSLYEYSLTLQDSLEDQELQQRLELFQIFSKLYERHRDLLNEILSLEDTGARLAYGARLFHYVQGVVLNQRVFLLTNLGHGKSRIFEPPQPIWTFGRDSRQVSLPIRDKRLSRRHAAIHYCPQAGFHLIDLGSTNGTFVNGERIRRQISLKDGDRVRLGSITFSFFSCQGDRSAPTAVPPTLSLEKVPATEIQPDERGHESVDDTIVRSPVEANLSEPRSGSTPIQEETLHFIRNRSVNN